MFNSKELAELPGQIKNPGPTLSSQSQCILFYTSCITWSPEFHVQYTSERNKSEHMGDVTDYNMFSSDLLIFQLNTLAMTPVSVLYIIDFVIIYNTYFVIVSKLRLFFLISEMTCTIIVTRFCTTFTMYEITNTVS